jgi:endonuclease I
MKALRENYDVSLDEKGELYCGIILEWNYDLGYVDISMPGYVEKQLTRYNHNKFGTDPPHRR